MGNISVQPLDDAESERGTPGIEREVVFETDGYTLMYARMPGGAESDWHHHGDNHVYGYLESGAAIFEHGPNGERRTDVGAGEFFHVQPRTVHRVRNPSNTEQIWLLNYLGSGSLVENVAGPGSN